MPGFALQATYVRVASALRLHAAPGSLGREGITSGGKRVGWEGRRFGLAGARLQVSGESGYSLCEWEFCWQALHLDGALAGRQSVLLGMSVAAMLLCC